MQTPGHQPENSGGSLRSLILKQFRNYGHAELEFKPGLTVLLGPNGQGKTNILEAVHYLAFLRSFRTRQIKELIRFGADGFQLQAGLAAAVAESGADRLSVTFGRDRRLFLNGAPMDKGSEFINQFFCVAFIPEDIELVKGPAAERRRWLDMLTGQLDRSHLRDLHAYNHALKSRNAILRQFGKFDAGSLDAYDQLLARHGAAVIQNRRQTVGRLASCALADSAVLVNGTLEYEYLPGLPKSDPSASADDHPAAGGDDAPSAIQGRKLQEAYLEMLVQNRSRDLRDGVTVWGPHRDELVIRLSGRLLSAYGSEGQCRASALWLRVASARILREYTASPQAALYTNAYNVAYSVVKTRE